MPKTLVIVATTDLATDQRLQRAAAALQEAGWQVTLLGRVLPHSPALTKQPYRQVRLYCPVYKGPFFYLLFNLMAAAWLAAKGFGVITACDADTLPGAWLASRLRGSRLGFDAHEYFSQVPEVVRRPSVQLIWQWVEYCLIPKVDFAYTVGPALAKLFTGLYGVCFRTIRNVPEASSQAANYIERIPKSILYTGALNEGRGLEELLQTLATLPAYSAVLCGDGPLEAYLHQEIARLGLQNRVRYTGRISPIELKVEAQKAWIGFSLLVPIGESYRLSLANKFFDYIQACLPQICPSLPEYEAILKDYPVGLALSCKVESIRKAILQMEDEMLYRHMQAACDRAANVFTWEEEKAALIRLYEPWMSHS